MLLPRTVLISVTKDGVKFSTSGDIGSANVTLRQHSAVDKVRISSELPARRGSAQPAWALSPCSVLPSLHPPLCLSERPSGPLAPLLRLTTPSSSTCTSL